jgi:hypothetical protein
VASSEIHSVQTVSGNQPRVRRIVELAGETFLPGTPVQIDDATGAVEAWDGTTEELGIAGFSLESASDLASTGVAETLHYGSVPNQPLAENIPIGAPLNDGRIGFEVANDDTVFRGQVGPAQTVAQANVGNQYGLTIDTDGHWYVDLTDTSDVVVRIVKLDPNDQSTTPRGVYFVVIPLAQQLQG